MISAPESAPCTCVIDDDDAVRVSIRALLEGEGYEIHLFKSVREFLEVADRAAVGCLALDYRMPDIDGVTALPQILERCPGLSVVMITAHGDVDVAVRAMKAGAFDFVEKPWARDAFLDVVRRAVEASGQRAALVQRVCDAKARIAALTPREQDVFEKLVTGAPNKIIAHHLDLSPRTVEFHRARVFEKMDVRSVAELVRIKTWADGP